MKKRTILFSLAVVVLLMMVMPGTALAGYHHGNWARPTDFSGGGTIYVTYMPDPEIKWNIWRYQGEIVEGFLEQCDWDMLAGTVFWSEHSSTVRVDRQYNAWGFMRGTFSLTRPDGTGALSGRFSGTIRGNLYTGDIFDQGTWMATGGTGVFEGVRAWGRWSADLHFGEVGGQTTLVGPLSWSGKYKLSREPKGNIREMLQDAKDNIRKQIEGRVNHNVRDRLHDWLDKWDRNKDS
jgi:hypothetical protein